MDRKDVLARLAALEPRLRELGVGGLSVFGSYARDRAVEGSDLDVVVDKAATARFGFEALMGTFHMIQDTFPGVRIDLGTREGLSPYVREAVEQEALRVF